MTPGLIKMWISFIVIFMLAVAGLLVLLARAKLRGILKMFTTVVAYILFFIASFLMILIIFDSPA